MSILNKEESVSRIENSKEFEPEISLVTADVQKTIRRKVIAPSCS